VDCELADTGVSLSLLSEKDDAQLQKAIEAVSNERN
jgi:hypothetical protein